jgi:hypothetical protein
MTRQVVGIKDRRLFIKIANWLMNLGVEPSHLSFASIGFACIAAFAIYTLKFEMTTIAAIWSCMAALFSLTLKFLCNISDRIISENITISKSSEIYKEIQERISDMLIILAVGYGTNLPLAIEMGWTAAFLALMTSHIRILGFGFGITQNFKGPMAKPQRTLMIVGGLIGTIFERNINLTYNFFLFVTLIIIIVGCIFTIYNRLSSLILNLDNQR